MIPKEVINILDKLINAGYEAYVVGGYVRDSLLNIDSYDIDITTSATVEEIKELFNVIDNGSKYLSYTIVSNNYKYEITTYRKDISYVDHRHPISEKALTLEEDLVRRDFTINALVLDKNNNIIDRYNGIYDIENKIIRTIGDPYKRFDEDALRILRAIYLKSKLQFEFEENTLSALYDKAHLVEFLSGVRKKQELYKMVKYNKDNSYIELFIKSGIINYYETLKEGLLYLFNNNIILNDFDLVLGICYKLSGKIEKKYEFDEKQKNIFKSIREVNIFDKYSLLDVSYEMINIINNINKYLNLDYIEDIEAYYNSLAIKSEKDLMITSEDLLKIIDKREISIVKEKLLRAILNNKVNNNYNDLINYIKKGEIMESVIKSVIYAKIDQIMSSKNIVNIIVTLDDKSKFNLKIEEERIESLDLNCIYEFEIAKNSNSDKLSAYVVSYRHVTEIEDTELKNNIYRKFMQGSTLDYKELKNGIESYINKIESKVLHDIVKTIIDKYENDFYLYPAASKLHHAYVGGLAYHTYGMLEVADKMLMCYKYLNKDLLLSGVILHDIGKVIEFSGVENTEYALKGQLLGHLLIGCDIIKEVCRKLGYTDDQEEVLMLIHMVASHHGLPQYGSIKKPCTAESAMLWYIDTIDSKFRVLGEELEKINPGEFTEPIGVMDRVKFYKHK